MRYFVVILENRDSIEGTTSNDKILTFIAMIITQVCVMIIVKNELPILKTF
jgi:hypothetical protein